MYKSFTTAKAELNKTSRSSREREASFNQSLSNRAQVDGNKASMDDLTELDNGKFTLYQIKNRAKISALDFLKTHLKTTSINEEIFRSLQDITNADNIHKLFENLFLIIKKTVDDHARVQANQKEVLISVRGKQSTKIKIVREEDSKKKTKTTKQLQQLEKTYDQIKKELFCTREQKISLQKKMMSLIQEFKSRKKFYIAEIKKLTDIVAMSPFDIRTLVLEKTKQAQQLEIKQQKSKQKNQRMSSFYNYEFPNHNEQINIIEPRKYPTGLSIQTKRQESGAINSELGIEPRPFKNITSIQHLQQKKPDLN